MRILKQCIITCLLAVLPVFALYAQSEENRISEKKSAWQLLEPDEKAACAFSAPLIAMNGLEIMG